MPPSRRSRVAAPPAETSGERVVLVHGFLANRYMLSVLARRLRRRGYVAEAWGYRNMCWAWSVPRNWGDS